MMLLGHLCLEDVFGKRLIQDCNTGTSRLYKSLILPAPFLVMSED